MVFRCRETSELGGTLVDSHGLSGQDILPRSPGATSEALIDRSRSYVCRRQSPAWPAGLGLGALVGVVCLVEAVSEDVDGVGSDPSPVRRCSSLMGLCLRDAVAPRVGRSLDPFRDRGRLVFSGPFW
jgi:hypothetical protein